MGAGRGRPWAERPRVPPRRQALSPPPPPRCAPGTQPGEPRVHPAPQALCEPRGPRSPAPTRASPPPPAHPPPTPPYPVGTAPRAPAPPGSPSSPTQAPAAAPTGRGGCPGLGDFAPWDSEQGLPSPAMSRCRPQRGPEPPTGATDTSGCDVDKGPVPTPLRRDPRSAPTRFQQSARLSRPCLF